MRELWYVDSEGRELGSVMAFSFREAHAWLTSQEVEYHSITKFRPLVRKGRERRRDKRRL